jgi:hypothetical protein
VGSLKEIFENVLLAAKSAVISVGDVAPVKSNVTGVVNGTTYYYVVTAITAW